MKPSSSRRERNKQKQEDNPQGYRFRRVLGDILRYLNTIPYSLAYIKCQKQFGYQLTDLVNRGWTWGYEYPVPVHTTDFLQLQRKEWAAIRAIVRKQQFFSQSEST